MSIRYDAVVPSPTLMTTLKDLLPALEEAIKAFPSEYDCEITLYARINEDVPNGYAKEPHRLTTSADDYERYFKILDTNVSIVSKKITLLIKQ